MIAGLYSAAAGMLSSQAVEGDVAANLANLDTPGYKGVTPTVGAFAPMLMQRVQNGASVPLGEVASGAVVASTPLDWTQGAWQATQNPLGAAIVGSGFFAVSTPQGVRYTRAGDFHLDAGGALVTASGQPVLGAGGAPVRVSASAVRAQVALTADGRLVAGGATLAALAVFSPPTAALQPAGAGLYALAPGVAAPAARPATLAVGMLEGSNVDVVTQMADLLEVQQAFTSDEQAVVSTDQSATTLISDVGAVP